jgi:naphtho-gamma-pyrone polyketide synthase
VPRQILNTVLPPADKSKGPAPAKKTISPQVAEQPKRPIAKVSNVKSAKSAAPSVLVQALKILASEVGLSESEMSDDLVFADYGVDSLLSLTITGKFREELNIDVESSVFMDYPSVKDFKQFLLQTTPSDSGDSSEDSGFFEDSSLSTDPSTPGTPGDFPSPHEKFRQPEESATMNLIRQTLCEEIGVSMEELTEDANLSEMGMDSLLSLTVLGKLRESLDLDLPSEFFIENQTLDDIETTLDLKPKAAPLPSSTAPVSMPAQMALKAEALVSSKADHPPASSILLQGNPKTATKTLFLFPDGSGSATSYAGVPKISSDVCVYGLNCPYMKTPENLNCGLRELTAPYVAEIRRRQPKGPYNFGGWSAGGICAYDAARQLVLEEGETVERLILLDSPFPIGLEKLPPRLYQFFDTMNIFGEGKAPPPSWLLPHFLAFIDALDAYKAVPLPSDDPQYRDRLPKTYLIWAKDGVCGKPGDPRPAPAPDGSKDPREMLWLLNDRTDFGPNGWDTLVGKDKVAAIETMSDANHFTMMKGDKGKELSSFLERVFR